MNKENYVSLRAEDVHKRLITDVALNVDEAPKLLDELTDTDRYQQDHIFRANVETSKVYILFYNGKISEVIKRCTHLIEVAILLEQWELLSFDYNLMANSYFLLGLYEKALEYYYSIINNEREHGLKNTLPVSYANIGLIFINIGLNEKAMEYLRSALRYIEYADEDYLRFKEKKAQILFDIIISATKIDKPDEREIEEIHSKMISITIEGLRNDILYSYYLGLMYYYFWKKDYKRAKEEYIKSRKVAELNETFKIPALYSFIEECERHNLDIEFFIDELLEAEKIDAVENYVDESIAYIKLEEYYTLHGNHEKADEIGKKYRTFLENNLELSKSKQADSILVIENALKLKRDIGFEQDKNAEFKLVAEEAIRNKDELQKLYDRIKMIYEIGLKLTSSTELNEVLKLIYSNIHENVPTDAFIFLAVEPENNQLSSLFSYNMGVEAGSFTLSFESKDSAFVKCCLNNKVVSSEDDDFKPQLEYIDDCDHLSEEDDMKSALFIPLSTGDRVIGAFSVQSKQKKAYTLENLDFLKKLSPYLVIALNNAIHSKKLKTEIEINKVIQEKLKEANSKLSRMAKLDALTQISNRREFNEKFNELRKKALVEAKTISVFMFDIDDFKKFNDTYGHFTGDGALKSVAKIINENIIENNGIAARFGGEEFISACIGLSIEENYALGEKIRKEIFDLGIENINTKLVILSISIGVAVSKPNKLITKPKIMSSADEMLYEAKKTGKNKVVIEILE